MPVFTNVATLSYTGGSTNSNTVTGQLLEVLSLSKSALPQSYGSREPVTYVLSLRNSGPSALTGLSLSDDLGGYVFGQQTVYPLAYEEGSARLYLDGVEQPAPTVSAGPPLTVTGLNVPAGSSLMLLYQARTTAFADPQAGGSITNTVTASGAGLSAPVTAGYSLPAAQAAALSISKSVSPATVTENSLLTYTFVIENSGSAPAVVTDDISVSDSFQPVLQGLSASLDGAALAAGTDYSYDAATGQFTTVPGRITVPAAEFTQNADGSFTVRPGVSVLVVSGTV